MQVLSLVWSDSDRHVVSVWCVHAFVSLSFFAALVWSVPFSSLFLSLSSPPLCPAPPPSIALPCAALPACSTTPTPTRAALALAAALRASPTPPTCNNRRRRWRPRTRASGRRSRAGSGTPSGSSRRRARAAATRRSCAPAKPCHAKPSHAAVGRWARGGGRRKEEGGGAELGGGALALGGGGRGLSE